MYIISRFVLIDARMLFHPHPRHGFWMVCIVRECCRRIVIDVGCVGRLSVVM